jgi:hypothetical protein
MRMLRHSHIAGFRLPIAGAGGFESQPLANFDSVRIYSRSLQLVDVQNISGPPASSVINPKPRSAFHIFNFPAPILFSPFQPEPNKPAHGFCRVTSFV